MKITEFFIESDKEIFGAAFPTVRASWVSFAPLVFFEMIETQDKMFLGKQTKWLLLDM